MSDRKRPRLPGEALRPRFWEVAGDRGTTLYETPFKKRRYEEQIPDHEMAGYMGMPFDDYVAMEEGWVRVVPEDVLRFCHAVQCHPLDLYVEPWGGVPLPKEIFEALLLIAEDRNYPDHDRDRCYDRLGQEFRQAGAILENNVDELRPLLVALGFSPDLHSFNAPLYRPTDISGLSQYARKKFATEILVDQNVDHPRVYIENCLNAYELELERHSGVHMSILAQFTRRMNRNKSMIEGLAVQLFGEEEAPMALMRLISMIDPNDAGKQQKLKERFTRDPNMLWEMTPDNQRILNAGGKDAEALCNKAKLLIHAAALFRRNEDFSRNSDMEGLSLSAYSSWYHFRQWRHNPRTQFLLDWMENWMVLNSRREQLSPVQFGHSPRHLFPFPRR